METTLPVPFLPSADLQNGSYGVKDGLTRSQISYLGCLYWAGANTSSVDILLRFLQEKGSIETFVDASAIDSKDDIISILDAGANKVFVTPKQSESLHNYEDRVLPVLSSQDQALSSAAYSNGALLNTAGDETAARSALMKLTASKTSPIFLSSTGTDLEWLVKVAAEFAAVPIIPTSSLTVGKASSGQISVPDLIGASWTSDRSDKLVPTVVTDERGIALGLVYSSQESLAESLKTGTGVYQSRKRGLWYKGATSGDTQELVRISLDCDQDCLKFVVRQKGRGKSLTLWVTRKTLTSLQVSVTYLNPPVLGSTRESLD